MTFSRLEQVVNDPPVAAKMSRQWLRKKAIIDPVLPDLGPAPPNLLKRERSDDTFEEVRQFRRVRIYTSLSTQAVSIKLATNVDASVYKVDMIAESRDSGHCFLMRDEDDVKSSQDAIHKLASC